MVGEKDERLAEALQNIDILRDEVVGQASKELDDEERASFLARIAELEEEADLLAVANADLRKENTSLKGKVASLESRVVSHMAGDKDSDDDRRKKELTSQVPIFTLPGLSVDDSKSRSGYIQNMVCKHDDVCGKSNPICVTFGSKETLNILEGCEGIDVDTDCLVHVGGADRKLYTYIYKPGDPRFILIECLDLPAPLLSAECCGRDVICSLMDGNLAVVRHSHKKKSKKSHGHHQHEVVKRLASSVQLLKASSKYLSCAIFSEDGKTIAGVCPNEKKVILYRHQQSGEGGDMSGGEEWALLATLSFEKAPESAVFVSSVDAGDEVLVVALRDSAHLVAVVGTSLSATLESDHETFQEYLIPINSNNWDDHASFSLLHVSLPSAAPSSSSSSDDAKDGHVEEGGVFGPLLVSTDKGSHLLVAWKAPETNSSSDEDPNNAQKTRQVCTSRRLATLSGHACSEYGKPSVAWSGSPEQHLQHPRAPHTRFVYSNSEEESAIYVYDCFTARTAATREEGGQTYSGSLQEHKGIVRGLAIEPSLNLLVSVSYDHSMIVWSA